jgi:hypothetical protein
LKNRPGIDLPEPVNFYFRRIAMNAVLASTKYQIRLQRNKKMVTWTVFTLWQLYPRGRLLSMPENELRKGDMLLVVSSTSMMFRPLCLPKLKMSCMEGVSIEDDFIHVFESYEIGRMIVLDVRRGDRICKV